jgi:hypothetical protein
VGTDDSRDASRPSRTGTGSGFSHRSAGSGVAQRLNDLFATVTYESNGRRREYSTPAVARAISDDPSHDTTISRVYLNGLRNGSNTNPTVSVVRAIAKFFDEHRSPGTPPITSAYLLGDDVPEDRELREKLADRQVRTIAMRAGNMDDRMRSQVLKMLDVLDPQSAEQSENSPQGENSR